jgi:predicted nucleotidyltransferase
MSTTADRRPTKLGDLRARRDEILSLAGRYGASNLRVFGSVAREEPDARDVDLLIDLEAGRSLLDLARLHVELEDLLGCDVDVAERVKPRLREQVEAEAVKL